MRRREHYWSLFHTTEKNQLNDLRTDQVEAIFAAIPPSQKNEWLIWREGFASWKSFTEFPELLLALRSHSETPIAPPPAPAIFIAREPIREIEANSEIFHGDEDLSLEEHLGSDGRIQPRYKKKFELRIELVDRIFTTTTTDVSMNGMQVKDLIPAGTSRYIPVELRSGGSTLSLLCSAVRGKSGGPTTRLRIEVNDNPDLLFSLLLEGQ